MELVNKTGLLMLWTIGSMLFVYNGKLVIRGAELINPQAGRVRGVSWDPCGREELS